MVQAWAEWITKPSRKTATRPPIRGRVEEPRYVQRGWLTPASLLFLCAGTRENHLPPPSVPSGDEYEYPWVQTHDRRPITARPRRGRTRRCADSPQRRWGWPYLRDADPGYLVPRNSGLWGGMPLGFSDGKTRRRGLMKSDRVLVRPIPEGEENRPPLRGESNAPGRAGGSAFNHGAQRCQRERRPTYERRRMPVPSSGRGPG